MTISQDRRRHLDGARARKRQQLGPPPSPSFRAFVQVDDHYEADAKAAVERRLVGDARRSAWPYVLRRIRIDWCTAAEAGIDQLDPDERVCHLVAEAT